MNKNVPTKAIGPPGRPVLPPEAEQEIMDTLSVNMRISSNEIAAILKKHGVSGDTDTLQNAYRKRLGQRLMASIRDECGQREVMAHGSEYVVLECCNDRQALKAIRQRIQSQMNGLDDSAARCAAVFMYWTICSPGSRKKVRREYLGPAAESIPGCSGIPQSRCQFKHGAI